MERLSEAELRQLLADLESRPAADEAPEAQS